MTVKRDAIIATIETTNVRVDILSEKFEDRMNRLSEAIEALTLQTGVLTETTTRLENTLVDGFKRMEVESQKRNEQVDKLLNIVERLIPA